MLADLITDVTNTANIAAVLLVLATVFTSEVERRREQHRTLTSPSDSGFRTIGGLAVVLAVFTVGSFGALAPLAGRVVGSIGSNGAYQAGLVIFVISWMLLLALFLLQVSIAYRAYKRK